LHIRTGIRIHKTPPGAVDFPAVYFASISFLPIFFIVLYQRVVTAYCHFAEMIVQEIIDSCVRIIQSSVYLTGEAL